MDRSEGVPSNEELESFKIYLQHQEAEKVRRIKKKIKLKFWNFTFPSG